MIQFLKNLFFSIFRRKKKAAKEPKITTTHVKVPAHKPLVDPAAIPKKLRQKTTLESLQVDRSKFRVVGRKFLGELFPERKDANYEKAHLRAYLRGEPEFTYGFTYDRDGQRHAAVHAVKQKLITEKI